MGAALAAAPGGAYAGTDARSLAGYAASLLGEWLSPPRLAALQTSCGVAADEPGAPSLLLLAPVYSGVDMGVGGRFGGV